LIGRRLFEIHAVEKVHHEVGRAIELGRHVRIDDAHDVLALDLRGRTSSRLNLSMASRVAP